MQSLQSLKQMGKFIPQTRALTAALDVASTGGRFAKKTSVELFGYDFFGLFTKIIVYSLIVILIRSYFNFVISGSGVIKALAGLAGWKLPSVLPDNVVNFFKDGYNGITFEDITKALLVILIAAEGINYYESNKKLGGQPSY